MDLEINIKYLEELKKEKEVNKMARSQKKTDKRVKKWETGSKKTKSKMLAKAKKGTQKRRK